MKRTILLGAIFLLLEVCTAARDSSCLKLWYDHPAGQWVEALPVGNGRLGAMVFGDPSREILQLNENTIWAGGPNRNDNPDARAALPEIRKLIFEGKYKEALVDCSFAGFPSLGAINTKRRRTWQIRNS